MKKYVIITILIGSFLLILPEAPENLSQTIQSSKKSHLIYSHGFGQIGKVPGYLAFLSESASAPTYPDAPANFDKAVFYTQPAVHVLANELCERVIEDKQDSIMLVGYSCGAGTAINCLAQLIDYDPEYFKGTKITSKADADTIIVAVNNGAFISIAPLLAVSKSRMISDNTALLTNATCAVGVGLAWNYVPSICEGKNSQDVVKMAIIGGGALAYSLFADQLKDLYSSGITKVITPWFTNYHFDPHHPEPIDEIQKLRGKITCPILLHFHKKDGVLEDPDNDTIGMYDALKGDTTHIIITDDAWHNMRSEQLVNELQGFKKKYFNKEDIDLRATQPRVDQLRKQIYPTDVTSMALRNKTLLISAAALAGYSVKNRAS